MPRLQRALPEAITTEQALDYLQTQLPVLEGSAQAATGLSASFESLASAAKLMDAKGPDIARAAAVYVDRTNAKLAVAAVDLMAETKPELFVTVVEAFTVANGRGGKLRAPCFFIAQFMNTPQTFNPGFAGKKIRLPKGYPHGPAGFNTTGSQLLAGGHTQLFTDVLDQAFSNAWRGMTPSYEQQPALLELTDKRAKLWNKRYEAIKQGG